MAKLGAARAGLDLCRISVAGDSIAAGESANPYGANAWPSRMRDRIVATGVPSGGSGLVLPTSQATPRDSRWTGSARQFDAAFNKGSLVTLTGGSATFTSDVAGTIVELWHHGDFPIRYSIDGGAPVDVPDTGLNAMKLTTITGLPNTVHTVVVSDPGGGAYIGGVSVRQSTGLHVSNFGLGGSTTGHWCATPGVYQPAATVAAYPVDLTILSLGTNDVLQSAAAAIFKTNMQAMITQFKAVSDVILVTPIPVNGQEAHRTALYELADSNDLPLIDFTDRWGSTGTASGLGLMFDVWHPNAKGYADLGSAVAAVLA